MFFWISWQMPWLPQGLWSENIHFLVRIFSNIDISSIWQSTGLLYTQNTILYTISCPKSNYFLLVNPTSLINLASKFPNSNMGYYLIDAIPFIIFSILYISFNDSNKLDKSFMLKQSSLEIVRGINFRCLLYSIKPCILNNCITWYLSMPIL